MGIHQMHRDGPGKRQDVQLNAGARAGTAPKLHFLPNLPKQDPPTQELSKEVITNVGEEQLH